MPSWHCIVDAHAGLVWRTIRRLLPLEADAADCFQDTFLAVFEAHRAETVRHWPAFLVKTATNRALDRLRRIARDRRRIETDHDVHATTTVNGSPEDLAVERELAGRLRLAVATLPEDQAEVFLMATFEPLSHADIATALGLTANHVGVLLHRARRSLRARLSHAGRQGFCRTDTLLEKEIPR